MFDAVEIRTDTRSTMAIYFADEISSYYFAQQFRESFITSLPPHLPRVGMYQSYLPSKRENTFTAFLQHEIQIKSDMNFVFLISSLIHYHHGIDCYTAAPFREGDGFRFCHPDFTQAIGSISEHQIFAFSSLRWQLGILWNVIFELNGIVDGPWE